MSVCSVSECEKPVCSRGWCQAHYARWRRYGDPLISKRATPNANPPELCSVDGCSKAHKSKGYCIAHYTRVIRYGSPEVTHRAAHGEPMSWILKHSSYDSEECLAWPYATGGRGDAVIWHNGRMRSASRVMCEIAHGIPEDKSLECAHNCGKGHEGCMNPGHLRWDTRSGNHSDKVKHGTHFRGVRNPGAILTEEQVRFVRSSGLSNQKLGDKFGVSGSTIHAIRSGKNWVYLDAT